MLILLIIWPRNITERNIALNLHYNHFCLIWKPEGVSFNIAVKEMGRNLKIVDNYITEENVKCFFEYIYQPKRNESHLTNLITYDLETHNSDRANLCILFLPIM